MKSEILSIQKKNNIVWPEKDTYLYLCWLNSENISGLALSSSHLRPSNVLGSNLFNLIDFFAPDSFIFSSELLSHRFQSQLKKSSVIVLRNEGIVITSGGYERHSHEEASENGVFENADNEKVCPLRHLLLLSETLNEKQLNSFRLAMKHGFPTVNLIDFDKRTIEAKKEEIILEWNSMISDQKGSLEEDFVRTLRYALKSLEKEHICLFERIYSITPPGDYSGYSLAPLFSLLPYVTVKKSKTAPIQPRVGISALRFEAIFQKLEKRNIPDLIGSLKKELSSDFFKVNVNEMKRLQQKNAEASDEEYHRVRISIALEAISDFVDLEDSIALVRELEHLAIEDVLHEVSIESYEEFKNRKTPEFWLKNVDIAVEVPSFMADETREIIRNSFGSHLIASQPVRIIRKSEDRFKIVFSLYFSMTYDYVIDRKSKGLFLNLQARDPDTKIGIEYLMRKEFNQALNFFKKAKTGLIRDYLENFGFSKFERIGQIELINASESYLPLGDILPREILLASPYTDESNPREILDMITNTEKWIQTAMKFREIDSLEREIRLHVLSEEEYTNIVSKLRGLLVKTEIKLSKNFFNFIEDIGSFYVDILQKTEEEAPESVKEWMRLSF